MDTTSELAQKDCQSQPKLLGEDEISRLLPAVPRWSKRDHSLERTLKFPDFRSALDFTNRLGGLAEAQNHHPDIGLSWGRVAVSIRTHKPDGLTENDFIMAAKIDRLSEKEQLSSK